MKNYYEILEVDKNASQEVIEKAYKVLAKKYHPDLQQGEIKQHYAEKMKLINEAYDILSDNIKRVEYDEGLQREKQREQQKEQMVSREQYEKIVKENENLIKELGKVDNKNVTQIKDADAIANMNKVLEQEIKAAREKAYQDAYIQDLKNRGYTIRYKRDFKYYLKLAVVIVLTIFIFYLIYQIPFVKNYCQSLYNENMIVKTLVDMVKDTILINFKGE